MQKFSFSKVSHYTVYSTLLSGNILTEVEDDCRCEGNPPGISSVRCVDREQQQNADGATADEKREVEEEGEGFTGCLVDRQVVGDDETDGESNQGTTKVKDENTSHGRSQTV